MAISKLNQRIKHVKHHAPPFAVKCGFRTEPDQKLYPVSGSYWSDLLQLIVGRVEGAIKVLIASSDIFRLSLGRNKSW